APSTAPPAGGTGCLRAQGIAATGSARIDAVLEFACQQLGDAYVWGAAGPDAYDCSGLTMRAWERGGVSLPHFAQAQYEQTRAVPVGSIQPGDLLFWTDSSGYIYHEGLYVGGGRMIHAPNPSRRVELVSYTWMGAPDLASRP
ncbi:MAG: C40 family peptidase, partial [Actinomycetota bacterium]